MKAKLWIVVLVTLAVAGLVVAGRIPATVRWAGKTEPAPEVRALQEAIDALNDRLNKPVEGARGGN